MKPVVINDVVLSTLMVS